MEPSMMIWDITRTVILHICTELNKGVTFESVTAAWQSHLNRGGMLITCTGFDRSE